MTIKEAWGLYPKIETELLLGHVLNKPKEFLYTHTETKLTATQLQKFKSFAERRINREPIAYILGYKDFYGLKFKVNKNVLIPRPETEWLVEQALKLKKIKKILDLATGSGCIAISLKKHLPNAQVTASDISSKALAVARTNARLHKTKIRFIKSDLFSNIKGQFDLIIANLPYVPISDYKKLRSGLKYEPKKAITDGSNTAKIYKKFLKQADKYLGSKGIILLEIDPKTKKYLPYYLRTYLPKAKVKFYKDLSGFWRYAEIKKS